MQLKHRILYSFTRRLNIRPFPGIDEVAGLVRNNYAILLTARIVQFRVVA